MVNAAVTYHDLIARNRRNSILLVVGFVLFVAVVVGVLGSTLVGGGDPTVAVVMAAVGLMVAVAMSASSYYGGGRMILQMSGAHRVAHGDDPELYNVVEEMAIAAGVPAPPVYLIDDTALNAFATGRDPEHAALAITQGLRRTLSRDELQAVIAHEMSHVRHYDIRLAMLLATLVGVVVLVSDFFMRGVFWGGIGRRGRGRSGDSHPLAAVMILLALVLAVVSPLIAKIIQLGASRQREYLADAGAVELTRNPAAMISALQRLGGDKEVLEVANRATAHLYIVPPIKKFEARARGMFATHPPLEDRIRRLQQL